MRYFPPPWCRLGSPSSRISTTAKSMDRGTAARDSRRRSSAGASAHFEERGETWVFGSDELYMLAGRELPDRRALRRVRADREWRWRRHLAPDARRRRARSSVARRDGQQIGVVTGKAMAPLMPPLLEKLRAARWRDVRADRRGELSLRSDDHYRGTSCRRRHPARARRSPRSGHRADSSGDDQRRSHFPRRLHSGGSVANALPMPVFPSYDFIDVLESEASGVLA